MKQKILMAIGVALLGLSCDSAPPEQATSAHATEVAEANQQALSLGLQVCAGPLGLTCPANQYCRAIAIGRCPSATTLGLCSPKPQVCTKIFDPVCGCDGKTYGNACVAASAGVAIAARGACPVACKSNSDCASGSFCDRKPGQCGEVGVCAVQPQICPLIFRPVCGCDGKTYGNACQAASAGVSVASEGECPKPPEVCKSNADCDRASYCAFKPFTCSAPGTCTPRPQICPQIFQPVCGCDGKTYSNRCVAASAGVSVASVGECKPRGPFCGGIAGFPCPGAGTCVDDPTDDCDPKNGGADCGGICQCNVQMTCAPGNHFDGAPEVCQCVADVPNPCAAVLCPVQTQCVVVDGKPACLPLPGPTCGAAICPAGQVCCNASCGICTPPGGACIQIACQ